MKLAILGGVGAGKSAAAGKISADCGIRVYPGDEIAHGYASEDIPNENGRFRRTPGEESELIEAVLAEKQWIWEGVYRETQEIFLEQADRILLLDTPYAVRVLYILKRLFLSKLGIRPLPYPTSFIQQIRWTRAYAGEAEIPVPYRDKVICVRNRTELDRVRKELCKLTHE